MLDIVVVDDGSTDDCGKKVKSWAEREPRLRLLRQPNSGVAAARNFGAAHTKANYLAFIDADDLWAPEKIDAQFKVLRESGDNVGLVYCWYAHIDLADRVLSLTHQPAAEGWVLHDLLRSNVVGNGSSALFRRTAFERAGGFDTRSMCDGCEDLALCLRIAEYSEFRVIKRHLVGYRILLYNKSSDARKMVRSCATVLSDYRQRYPGFRNEMDRHLDEMRFWLLVRAASAGRYRSGRDLVLEIWRSSPSFLMARVPLLFITVARASAPSFLKTLVQTLLVRLTGRGMRYCERAW